MNDSSPSPFGPPASGRSINALVLNVILPGLGTIVGGKTGLGVGQLILFLVGIPLLFFFGLGIVCIVGAWIWAVITGFRMMSDTTQGPPPAGLRPPGGGGGGGSGAPPSTGGEAPPSDFR